MGGLLRAFQRHSGARQERVFPHFWKLFKKELDKKKAIPRKGTLLKSSGDYKTSLLDYCKHVVAISKGKAKNNLSTNARKRELQRAGITEELILMEFVKFNESKTLKKKEEEESEKYKAMKDVIAANGTEVASQRAGQSKIAIEKCTISCHHPSVDSDDEDDGEPSEEVIARRIPSPK